MIAGRPELVHRRSPPAPARVRRRARVEHSAARRRLMQTRNVIGRDCVVSAFVDDPHVSGQHASIRCEKMTGSPRGEFVLRDLDSESRTTVNGVRFMAETVLKHRDVIGVGRTELVFKRLQPGVHRLADAYPALSRACRRSTVGDHASVCPRRGPGERG